MNYVLTDKQQAVIEADAKAEIRSVKQTVGLLLAEGVKFMYADDYARYGNINETELEETLMKECRELH